MPTYVAAGAVASGTGAISPALPSGIQTNDILLLFLETANQTISISNQNGGTWTQVTNSPQGTGTGGSSGSTALTVFWSRYNGTPGCADYERLRRSPVRPHHRDSRRDDFRESVGCHCGRSGCDGEHERRPSLARRRRWRTPSW